VLPSRSLGTLVGAGGLAVALGLCLDLARLYMAGNELENRSRAASRAAAERLDGSAAGLEAAIRAARAQLASWTASRGSPTSVTVEFAPSPGGIYLERPRLAAKYRFTRVRAQEQVPVYFLSAFGIGPSRAVAASAVSGQ